MKRLVICCDGTWNKPGNQNVTNIEKIARTVETDLRETQPTQQLVHYIGGVGTSYGVDRLLGGAFGLGLFNHVITAYRFLALNYQPGDQIFVFGFSRGAYTARSLVGMISKVGLLTREAVIADKLPEAEARYRGKSMKGMPKFGSDNAEFKRDHCHTDLRVAFLGVFDTVGQYGVPGPFKNRYKFLDVKLSPVVVCARQALAIDERRIKFEPCLWEVKDKHDDPGRVKQVWFEGVHSDVGGGYQTTGLSDTTLLWMLREANMQGLAFNTTLLSRYLESNSPAERHQSLTIVYRVLNLVGRVRNLLRKNSPFRGSWRRIDGAQARDVRIASSAQNHFESDDKDYRPPNIAMFKAESGGWEEGTSTFPVIALPEPAGLLDRLTDLKRLQKNPDEAEYVDLSLANQTRLE